MSRRPGWTAGESQLASPSSGTHPSPRGVARDGMGWRREGEWYTTGPTPPGNASLAQSREQCSDSQSRTAFVKNQADPTRWLEFILLPCDDNPKNFLILIVTTPTTRVITMRYLHDNCRSPCRLSKSGSQQRVWGRRPSSFNRQTQSHSVQPLLSIHPALGSASSEGKQCSSHHET